MIVDSVRHDSTGGASVISIRPVAAAALDLSLLSLRRFYVT
jgi:hypothetical protein